MTVPITKIRPSWKQILALVVALGVAIFGLEITLDGNLPPGTLFLTCGILGSAFVTWGLMRDLGATASHHLGLIALVVVTFAVMAHAYAGRYSHLPVPNGSFGSSILSIDHWTGRIQQR